MAGAFLHPEAVPPETPWDPGAGLAVGLLFWWGRGGVLMPASPERGRLNAQVIYSVREPSFSFSLEVLYEACMGERAVTSSVPRAQLGAPGSDAGPAAVLSDHRPLVADFLLQPTAGGGSS